jgi:hypothetical protein
MLTSKDRAADGTFVVVHRSALGTIRHFKSNPDVEREKKAPGYALLDKDIRERFDRVEKLLREMLPNQLNLYLRFMQFYIQGWIEEHLKVNPRVNTIKSQQLIIQRFQKELKGISEERDSKAPFVTTFKHDNTLIRLTPEVLLVISQQFKSIVNLYADLIRKNHQERNATNAMLAESLKQLESKIEKMLFVHIASKKVREAVMLDIRYALINYIRKNDSYSAEEVQNIIIKAIHLKLLEEFKKNETNARGLDRQSSVPQKKIMESLARKTSAYSIKSDEQKEKKVADRRISASAQSKAQETPDEKTNTLRTLVSKEINSALTMIFASHPKPKLPMQSQFINQDSFLRKEMESKIQGVLKDQIQSPHFCGAIASLELKDILEQIEPNPDESNVASTINQLIEMVKKYDVKVTQEQLQNIMTILQRTHQDVARYLNEMVLSNRILFANQHLEDLSKLIMALISEKPAEEVIFQKRLFELRKSISEMKPEVVIAEKVMGILKKALDGVDQSSMSPDLMMTRLAQGFSEIAESCPEFVVIAPMAQYAAASRVKPSQ